MSTDLLASDPNEKLELAFAVVEANINELEHRIMRITALLSCNAVKEKRASWIRRSKNGGE